MAEMTPEAFEREARRMRPAMLSLARRITGSPDDAADVVQESLLKLWFFRNRLSDYRTVDAPAMVIVRRLSLNHIRSRMLTVEPEASMAAQEPDIDEGLSDELSLAIESLPSTEQAVLRMRHIDEMEIDDIARIMQSSPGAVRTALSRARKRVRDRFMALSSSSTLTSASL